jgi:predicted MPP superfamily phosphohydrolase
MTIREGIVQFLPFIIILLLVLLAAFYYIARRFHFIYASFFKKPKWFVFYPVFFVCAIATMWFFPVWNAVLLYFLFWFVFFDFCRLCVFLIKKLRQNKIPEQNAQNSNTAAEQSQNKKEPHKAAKTALKCVTSGFLCVAMSLATVIYGYLNANHTIIKTYDLTAEENSGVSDLKIVLISDIHLGTTVKLNELDELVSRVSALQPDIIAFGGDIFDQGTAENEKEPAIEKLAKMRCRLGKFYVHGNHDREQSLDAIYEKYGIVALSDELVSIKGIQIAGRIDGQRENLENLLKNAKQDKPLILLDHQPKELEKAAELGVDLMLSGHTHAGQLFPLTLFIGFFNELSYGQKQIGQMTAIVGAGVGTWGFPVRTGSRSEIVVINWNAPA